MTFIFVVVVYVGHFRCFVVVGCFWLFVGPVAIFCICHVALSAVIIIINIISLHAVFALFCGH